VPAFEVDRRGHEAALLPRNGAAESFVSFIPLLGRTSRCRDCLLENNDLTGMVKVVLRRAEELGVGRVLGAQLLRKPLRGEGPHGALELLIQLLQGVLGLAPGVRTNVYDWRPLFRWRELRTLSANPPKNQVVPADDVKDDFPNAVGAGYWMSCGLFR
jgi:hypothetical protein